jgi:hypothetical protein
MSSDIRAALERLVRMLSSPRDEYEYYDAMTMARAALAAEPVGEGPSDYELLKTYCDARRAFYFEAAEGESDQEDRKASAIAGLRAVLSRWGCAAPPAPEAPAEALAARPIMEQVARLVEGPATLSRLVVISDRAAAWLRDNPPGQPVAIEPRGCPTPGACSCVEPAPAAPVVGEAGELVAQLEEDGKYLIAAGYANESVKTRDLGIRVIRIATLLQQLSAPAPVVVPVGDVAELVAELVSERLPDLRQNLETVIRSSRAYDGYSTMTPIELADRIIDAVVLWHPSTLLEQQAAPAPVAVQVAVAERLPGEGDCAQWPNDEDESCEPWCWQFTFDEDGWEVMQASKSRLTSPLLGPDGPSHWLPAHAISLPQAGEGEREV